MRSRWFAQMLAPRAWPIWGDSIRGVCEINLTKVGEFVESEPLVIPLVDLRLNCAFCVVSCR